MTSREQDGRPRIGVEIDQQQPHPFTLKIDLDDIGGPSAGLMFALGIVDKMTAGRPDRREDHRRHRHHRRRGHGSARSAASPQKLVGAKEAGAKVFLTPADNCAEAVRNPQPGLPLVKVGTLDDALTALETLRAGGQPTRC